VRQANAHRAEQLAVQQERHAAANGISRFPMATPSCHSGLPEAALDFTLKADISLIGGTRPNAEYAIS
jgi:hypothetical protein